ncbi:DCN1-like protein 1 [Camellia lanceoleosa]|uniref:DCN1-like protein 1 n=1 Tax=Camellia lanceoleosa TaxID=1840588 RepID=A0ACC0F9U4_9ERIC|nr:DCN1-like protein 1 [Camellia lanceoleosa]
MKEVLEVLKEISSVGYDRKVADDMDKPIDNVVLLKSDPSTLSPNSLRQKWLVLSWHMKAATMCEFSKQEFIRGLQALGIDSLEKFCDRMQFMHSELKDERWLQSWSRFECLLAETFRLLPRKQTPPKQSVSAIGAKEKWNPQPDD